MSVFLNDSVALSILIMAEESWSRLDFDVPDIRVNLAEERNG